MTLPLTRSAPGARWSRRSLFRAAGLSGLSWLTPLAESLALRAETSRERPRSVILLWLQGGASQLETFDPHPGSPVAYGARAIPTALPGVLLGESLARTAELLPETTLVRSLVSQEGDHERATYQIKTGYRRDPSLVHPSLGAVICHELPGSSLDIPAHISILPGPWPARGGYLGAAYDAFKTGDPVKPLPDLRTPVAPEREAARLADLEVAEAAFARGRIDAPLARHASHRDLTAKARRMMSSEQLAAFDVNEAPVAEREAYGDHEFGRACLAALRLVEAGVRCVEVTLNGWDTHANNHAQQNERAAILDAALSSLIRDLRRRDLHDQTIVICGGEFGRTPRLNGLEGRDHWPHGFSALLAGGGIRRGHVHGATDPSGEKQDPADPVRVEDLHATILHALGIDPAAELMTPIARPLALSAGKIVPALLRES